MQVNRGLALLLSSGPGVSRSLGGATASASATPARWPRSASANEKPASSVARSFSVNALPGSAGSPPAILSPNPGRPGVLVRSLAIDWSSLTPRASSYASSRRNSFSSTSSNETSPPMDVGSSAAGPSRALAASGPRRLRAHHPRLLFPVAAADGAVGGASWGLSGIRPLTPTEAAGHTDRSASFWWSPVGLVAAVVTSALQVAAGSVTAVVTTAQMAFSLAASSAIVATDDASAALPKSLPAQSLSPTSASECLASRREASESPDRFHEARYQSDRSAADSWATAGLAGRTTSKTDRGKAPAESTVLSGALLKVRSWVTMAVVAAAAAAAVLLLSSEQLIMVVGEGVWRPAFGLPSIRMATD